MNIQVTVSGIPPVIAKAAFVLLLAALGWGDLSTLLAVALLFGSNQGSGRK